MVLTVHHLGKSQSERIVWLCEELATPYELVVHDRNPETALSPDSLKAIHPAGTAPVMIDDPSPTADGGRVALAESGAIAEYINAVYGGGRLALTPADKGYSEYVEWFHFANGSLQATLSRRVIISRFGGDEKPMAHSVARKWDVQCAMIEKRLKETGAYLAGPKLTLADIMTVVTFTTMRGFGPADLSPYPEILAYLKRIGEREAYQKAMHKGDPGMTPLLGPTAERFVFGSFGKK